MPLPKLSPLQSRLAASLMASIMLLILYFAFASPHFAYAADVDSIRPEDHNHERLLNAPFLDMDSEDLELREVVYEADFLGYDRGIIGRAPTSNEPTALINNRMVQTNVVQGSTVPYSFLSASLHAGSSSADGAVPSVLPLQRKDKAEGKEGDDEDDEDEKLIEDLRFRTRQSSSGDVVTLYVSVNTCSQPDPIQNTTVIPPPQLQLYISQSANNTNPGPSQDPTTQDMMVLEAGAGVYIVNATGDVFIGLYGENTTDYQGVWNAQIAASIDAPYHYFHNASADPNLYLVDTDSGSALLITHDLNSTEPDNSTEYEEWLNISPPYVMFASLQSDQAMLGVQNSYCGLQNYATIKPTIAGQTTDNLQTGITARGVDNGPKQQFYITGLAPGSAYNMVLAMNGNSSASGDGVVGGGGQVWPMTNFTTLKDGNCGVIFNLSFCDQTAYAVPGNPNTFPNFTSLAAFYDNATQAQYQFFQNVLQQIPCETTSTAQYSLAKTCDDCAAAYKEWLCSVTIPRCTDFSSTLPWLQERAMGQPFPNGTMLSDTLVSFANNTAFLNGSRNPAIDTTVIPGPYKEILPCDDLCYNIVRSCPASMAFACPLPGRIGYNQSYGQKPKGSQALDGKIIDLTCNYPGAAYYLSACDRIVPSYLVPSLMIVMMSLIV